LLLMEKEHLLPLAGEDFELAEISFPRVDQAGCAKVLANSYSVPLKPGSIVEARAYSSLVEFRYDGERIAQHQRSYGRAQQVLDLEHYLEVLERKPGALRGSKPLAQWRAQGRWPASYDRLWESMRLRHGRQGGARAMVAVSSHGSRVWLCEAGGFCWPGTGAGLDRYRRDPSSADERSTAACRGRVCRDRRSVAYERPLPTMAQYDQLLSGSAIEVQP
jgi:hypothetical protein